MIRKLGSIAAVLLTLAAAAGAYLLRSQQLEQAFDETGKMIAGMGRGPFVWICLAALVVFAVVCFLMKRRETYDVIAGRSLLVMALTMAAAVIMIFGCVSNFLDLDQMTDVLVATGGVVTAICWVLVGLDRVRNRPLPAAAYMVPALIFAVELICEFRYWSRDPQILDYCFDLLSLICVMIATFHLGGFCFDKGHRRTSVFFHMAGVFFTAAAMVDGSTASRARCCAALLWMLANLIVLLRPVQETE